MPLSKAPEKRKAQLSNLHPVGAVTHGATSEHRLGPVRERHRVELLERFPSLDEHRLVLLSDLLARCELARDFIDVRGLMRNAREPHRVLELLSRWERRAWAMLGELQPVRQPTEAAPPLIDVTDKKVSEASQALLRAINDARQRRLAADGKGA